jgi:hypothetical protein
MPLTDGLFVIIWWDGDNVQVQSIISNDSIALYTANRLNEVKKQNTAKTGTEQTADLGIRVFPEMNRLYQNVTLKEYPRSDLHPSKISVTWIFDSLTRTGKLAITYCLYETQYSDPVHCMCAGNDGAGT